MQRFFKLEQNNISDEALINKFVEIDKRENGGKLGRDAIVKCLAIIKSSKINYGAIDFTDDQHTTLLYWNLVKVSKRFTDKWEDLGQRLDELGAGIDELSNRVDKLLNVYKLAVIGAGSAAAYYVDSLGSAYDHRWTVLIGEANPWSAGPNGRGNVAIDFINHVSSQISFPSEGVPQFGVEFRKRQEFADAARRILERIETRYLAQKVIEVKQEEGTGLYVITWKDHKGTYTTKARKVVVATGAGPHAKPKDQLEKGAPEDRMIDMDTFIREIAPTQFRGKVIVQGPNAAIDAVAVAKSKGWEVIWFIRGTPPVYLPGTRYSLGTIPLYKVGDSTKVSKGGPSPIRVTANVKKCNLLNHQTAAKGALLLDDNWDPEIKGKTFDVDYLVYGIGQNINAPGAAGNFLDGGIKAKLTPVFDKGGRFNEVKQKSDGPNAFLGLGTNDSTADKGLVVIGAAARGLAPREVDDTVLHGVTRYLSSDVVAYEQLGGIRSAMHSLNEANPVSISKAIDFSNADATQLRIYMAVKYPGIKEDDARAIINEILKDRENYRTTGRFPHGYGWALRDYWEDRLKRAAAKK